MTRPAFQEKNDRDDVPILEKRETAPFHSVSMDTAGSLVITQADTPGLWVENREELIDYVQTTVSGGRLQISPGAGVSDELTVYVSMPDIKSIVLSADTRCMSRSILNLDNLEIIGSGASAFKLNVITGEMSSRLSGASILDLTGSAEIHIIKASGGVRVNSPDFITNSTHLNASGGVLANVNVDYDLSVKISGAVQVRYKGRTEEIKKKTSGQARVIRAD